MRIKSWEEFQHFKDRNPPWVKLYKKLLDDPDWHELPGKDAKVLVMLWLVASEDKNKNGNLPCLRKVAFRLRMKEPELEATIARLSGWLIQDDIKTISEGYQGDAPETEAETYTETYRPNDSFDLFWNLYPRKEGKAKANEWWVKNVKDGDKEAQIISGLKNHIPAMEEKEKKFIPHPTTWLNGKRWEDEIPEQKEAQRWG